MSEVRMNATDRYPALAKGLRQIPTEMLRQGRERMDTMPERFLWNGVIAADGCG